MPTAMTGTFSRVPPLVLPRQGHRLIFAFDDLMDPQVLEKVCYEPRLVGVARYTSKCFVINDAGVATLYPRRASKVWGVIWEISEFAQVGLDLCLGVPSECERFGSFAKGINGEMIASEYYGRRNNRTRGLASPDYLDKIIAAGQKHDLPAVYLQELRCWRIPRPHEVGA
jgi:hypothetical protein